MRSRASRVHDLVSPLRRLGQHLSTSWPMAHGAFGADVESPMLEDDPTTLAPEQRCPEDLGILANSTDT